MSEMLDRMEKVIDAELVAAIPGELDVREVAHAVLAALREPTPEMIEAVTYDHVGPRAIWQAMIDAELGER